MNCLPPSQISRRPSRVRPLEVTPAVLRFQDGHCASAKLQVVSLTGGLLSLPKPLNQGARVRVMFLTGPGPVLGAAEMLSPLSWSLQPFRFLELQEGHQHRLHSVIQSSCQSNSGIAASWKPLPAQDLESVQISDAEDRWIKKYRATVSQAKPPRRTFGKMILGAICVGTLCLSVIYLFQIHLVR